MSEDMGEDMSEHLGIIPSPTTPRADRWRQAMRRAEKAGIRAEPLGGEMWRVESASTAGKSYLVIVRDGSPVSCNCVGSYGGNVCQHRAAVAVALVPEGQMGMGL